jgi:hypothetical protein
LPPGLLGRKDLEAAADHLKPEWIQDSFEDLGLGRAIEDQILRWIFDGRVVCPESADSPLIVCVAEVLKPSSPQTPESLARITAHLYGAHERLSDLAGDRWKQRLDDLAVVSLKPEIEDLVEVLQHNEDRQWVMVDCLGLPLLEEGRVAMEKLGRRHIEKTSFALVGQSTTTDACFRLLAENGINHPLIKINAIDRLLHQRHSTFEEFRRLVAVELEIGLERIAKELDPRRPILVFADHGFRLNPDGRGFSHGGPSTLERVIPIFSLAPDDEK